MKGLKKSLSIITVLSISAALLAGCSAESAAKISSPALVSKVTKYDIDYGSDDTSWVETCSYEYEYKDGYPVSLKRNEAEDTLITDFVYELQDGLPVSMTCSNPANNGKFQTLYNNGVVDRVLSFDETGRKTGEQVFQYGKKDDYFTLVLHENIISPPEEPVLDHMEEVDSVIITSENGLLRKTVNDGLFANYNDEEEKIWRRFDGSYTANYDANGILDNTTAIFTTFPGSGNQYKFDITVEDGKVTEAVRNYWVPANNEEEAASDEDAAASEDSSGNDSNNESTESDGKWEPELRFVFEYTDTEISPARYASMINYFLLEGGSNYYIYNWY